MTRDEAGASQPLNLVEPRLSAIEALGVERLDRVGRARDDRLRVLVRLEVREDEVGERPPVAALRTADADPQPEKLLRPEMLRDRAQAVVPREPATLPR